MTDFDSAVQAIITGDEAALRALLRDHPELIRARAESPHKATLLHYIGANGVEVQRSTPNAPAIATILLDAGAEVDALAPIYEGFSNTPLNLTVTSVHPWKAGVQARLVDVLVDYGAKVDGLDDDGSPLGNAVLYGYTRSAERLAIRGARVDNIIYAAGLGQTDVVRRMLATGTGMDVPRRTDDRAGRFSFPVPRNADAREVALIVAAMHDRLSTVRAILDSGIDVNATPFCRQTALHFAAIMGNEDMADELLARGADKSVRETQFNQTAAEWAGASGLMDLAAHLG